MNKQLLCGALAAAISAAALCACTPSRANTDTIRVCEVTHSVFYAPQYAAIELGFFEDEGISIELTNGGGADKVMSAVLSEHCDIGLAGPEASIYIYHEGRQDHTQVFAQLTQRDGSILMSRHEEPDFRWSSLAGKHILPGRRGGVPYMAFEYALRQNGLSPKTDVMLDTSVQFENMTGAFLAGTADYVTVFEPTASSLAAQGKAYVAAAVGDAVGDLPYTAYFAKKSFLQEKGALIERFTRALARGQQWVAEHSAQEVANTIAPHFADTELPLLESAVARYQRIGAYCPDPVLREEGFARLQDVMMQAGELDTPAPFEAIVDNTFAYHAIK